ncbi:MAG TPA: 50S ribosomal protein L4 [Candidatus Cloacimonas sp.]|jgi:large subunit ribosomal protein L4|nr:large subunit ribosomal protein [Candidatus Cloacimonadota bacterium]HCX72757.1 50S ribosomal protein L4 [Candidatus Cloacimonas sp.]
MMQVIKYSRKGEEVGKVELPDTLFSVESKNPQALLYEVINMYLTNQRQGTSKVKGRSEVNGSGRKLYRQKGTGNARAGNLRTPVRVGGGAAFGPKPKNWHRSIPKKKKRLALKLALTQRAKNNQVIVVENLEFEKPETKKARVLIDKISQQSRKNLLVIGDSDKNIIKSFSNLPNVKMDRADGLFAYEILNCDKLILTEEALQKIEEVFNK